MTKALLTFFFLFPLVMQSQEYDFWNRPVHKLTGAISKGMAWEEILELVNQDSILSTQDYTSDIISTIEFLKRPVEEASDLDKLMIAMCTERDGRFYYRQSGNMGTSIRNYNSNNTEESIPEPHGEEIDIMDFVRTRFKYHQILKLKSNELVPRLIHYLSDDSATRQIFGRPDWNEVPFYLSVSDIAMEFLELYTLCDFYDNASSAEKIFSDRPEEEKAKLISEITRWWAATRGLDKLEAVPFYLDSICDTDASFFYTCNNIAHYGDTLNAVMRYRQLYDKNSLPCRKNHRVGKKLHEFGDEVMMQDCVHDIFDYRCSYIGRDCAKFIFENARSDIDFDILAEVVATEIHSRYRRDKDDYIWHMIFDKMARVETNWANSVLEELMRFDEVVKGSRIKTWIWSNDYKEQYEKSYRVCDFALLKYIEVNPDREFSVNWNSRKSINAIISDILKEKME